MNKAQFLKLLKKYREGTASEEEITFLNAYYNLFEFKDDPVKKMSGGEIELLKNQIKDNLKTQMAVTMQPARTVSIFRRWAVAASMFIMAVAGIFIYVHHQKDRLIVYRGTKINIAPGSNKAILVLANGSKIDLNSVSGGSIAQQGGTRIVKSGSGEITYNAGASSKATDTGYNTVYTPRSGKFMVILPDSTRAYLNAQSSIRFPAAFNGSSRNVQLTGEAYFEVAHNKNKPFHVMSAGQTVEVLGTHFDIKAYPGELTIRTTLLEGRVSVATRGHLSLLLPGQRAENTGGGISILKNIDAEESIAWKNGLFHFEQADIKEVMREFARWYDVQVVYEGPVKDRLFSGDIHKNLGLEQALELLNYENVHFIIDGRKIIITS